MNLIELLAPAGAEIFSTDRYDAPRFSVTQYGITQRNMPCYQIRMSSPIACLQYVRYGSGIIISGERIYRASAGDTFLLREGTDQIYYSNPDNQFERIWINFRGELPSLLLKLYGIEDVILFKDTDTNSILEDFFEIFRSQLALDVYQDMLERKLLETVQLLSKSKKDIPSASSSAEEIRRFIDRHVTERITLADISEKFSFSREHIVRMFKKSYGITPHQYMLQSKIRISMIMLIQGDKSIEEIADMLGFSAPEHFSATFLEYTGFRPSAYRRAQQ